MTVRFFLAAVGRVMTLALCAIGPGGCSLETDHLASGPVDAAAGADVTGETLDQREVPPPENCRWQGYGIGPPGQGQCEVTHLTAHAFVECTGIGGEPFDSRDAVGACQAGAEEIQMYCCFAADPPSLEMSSGITAFDHHLQGTSPPATREELLASAVMTCEQEDGRLADWSIIYDRDSAVARLRFLCLDAD